MSSGGRAALLSKMKFTRETTKSIRESKALAKMATEFVTAKTANLIRVSPLAMNNERMMSLFFDSTTLEDYIIRESVL